MAKAEQFEVGSIVKLKSGGPDMTVQYTEKEGEYLRTQWFAGKKLENGRFPISSVEEVKPAPKAE